MISFSNTTKEKFNKIWEWVKEHRVAAIPIFLVALVSVFNIYLISYLEKPWGIFEVSDLFAQTNLSLFENNYYGDAQDVGDKDGAANNLAPIDSFGSSESGEQVNFIIVDSAYLLNKSNPLSDALPTRDGLLIYKIQKGDTLAKVAANFGISLNTILWANTKLNSNALKIGQEIIILPVSGVLYDIQPGDTLDAIAEKYSVDVNKIISYNIGLSPAKLESRQTIIIPFAKPLKNSYYTTQTLPEYPGYFAIPTTGWNWGQLHNYNAVDIANACGTPVYASAEGLVTEKSPSGWNDGYGIFVVLEHPNNTKTRYAHLQKAVVSAGDYVSQGDVLGYIGNTGKTHGVTGCHLHFEIIGAKNPFAK